MTKKTALITGTSTGVGLSTAIKLAGKDFKVFATMRDLSKSDSLRQQIDAQNADIDILQLDVQDVTSVNSCIQKITEQGFAIDVLICNAGKGYLRPLEQAPEKSIKEIFDINVYGVMRCIKAVLPIMRKQGQGHIVVVSSVGGLVGQPLNEIYCASKFAVEGLCESMSSYLKPYFNIDISIIEPGAIKTEFANTVMKDIESSGGILEDAYKPIVDDYLKKFRVRASNTAQTPEEVADEIYKCIQKPKIRMRTSDRAELFTRLKTGSDKDGSKLQYQIQRDVLGIRR